MKQGKGVLTGLSFNDNTAILTKIIITYISRTSELFFVTSPTKTTKKYTWATTPENLTLLHEKNKGADQPAQLRSLVSAFVVRSLLTCF